MFVNFIGFQMLVGIGISLVDFFIVKKNLKETFGDFILWAIISLIVAFVIYAVQFI